MRRNSLFPIFLIWIFSHSILFAQSTASIDRFEILQQRLESYALEYERIDQPVDISFTGSLKEFTFAFSKETKINLTVDPSIDEQVVTNFSDTRPKDILLHLCRFYSLDLTFSGTIIGLIPYHSPESPNPPKLIDISYNDYNNRMELNLQNDTLDLVLEKISRLSKKNVIATKSASSSIVNGYIGASEFDDALLQLAKRNNLEVSRDEKGFYIVDLSITSKAPPPNVPANTKSRRNNSRTANNNRSSTADNQEGIEVKLLTKAGDSPLLNISADDATLSDLVKAVSDKSGDSFFQFSELSDKVSIKLDETTFEGFLTKVLMGTKFSYKKEGNLYLIGLADNQEFKETKVKQLKHRSVKGLVEFIPADLLSGAAVQEFIQLNSLVLSGSNEGISKLEAFIDEIDKSVPVVMIELLIIDVQDNQETRIGFEAGLANEPVESGGLLFPEVNFTFSSKAINKLLGTLAGNGVVNLGKVSPNFYATLQAVEANGFAKVRSKPRLSTLNGIEASLSLGETRYYLNERTTLQGNQNPISLQDRRYEAVNADFSIRLIPIVSGDEYVTLEIEVNQSDFIGQIQSDAPPPQVNRTFNSNIRILNQEMIVLGGLESKSVESSGSGVPLLSRIPIIKWLFSKRRKAKNKSKLLVFVKPTIIY